VLRALLWTSAVAVALYLAVCLLAFAFQRRLMYHPMRFPEEAARAAAARLGLAAWRDGKGALAGWRAAPSSPPRARALVLGGNGGCAFNRDGDAVALAGLGVEVVLLEYPGYGARPGAPSLEALGAAAADALDALAAEGPKPIWIVGESLGSGVAGRAVALRPGAVRGLLLLTPYARMREVAALHYPFLPSWLVLDRYAPADDLAGFRGPAFVVLAGRDEVVGLAQGRRLADRLPGPKRVVVQEEATHGGLELGPALWREAVELLAAGGG
jgi:pimeloyl-ACP methyl ester carboxylesterase